MAILSAHRSRLIDDSLRAWHLRSAAKVLIAKGRRMATEDLIQTRLKVDSFAKSSLDHQSEFWAPPLAPTDMPLEQETFRPATRDEQSFQPVDEHDLAQTETSFGSGRKLVELIVSTIIIAASGVVTLAYRNLPVQRGSNLMLAIAVCCRP